MTVVGLSTGTPGERERFIDVRDVAGKETADDSRQRKDPPESRMVLEVLITRQ
jgi:hypothetical protein